MKEYLVTYRVEGEGEPRNFIVDANNEEDARGKVISTNAVDDKLVNILNVEEVEQD